MRLLLAFVAVAACLWVFGALAAKVVDGHAFAFDRTLLEFAHLGASPLADDVFVAVSAAGYAWGVIPADIALIAWLALRRRFRQAAFAFFAIGGSALLNLAAKKTFRRERPGLWDSPAPELTYSFPSAHAMGSATLATVAVLIAWPSRYRWVVLAFAVTFVILVGTARVYLGVHYPTDVVAGWVAALAWCGAAHGLVWRRRVAGLPPR